jgi:hypothetical protein
MLALARWLVSLAVLGAASRAVAMADVTAAGDLYARAISAMNDLPQPAYLTYRLESSSEGLEIEPVVLHDAVWLGIRSGSTPDEWTLRHRTFDYQSEIVNTADGKRYVSQRSFFDPTWYGALRALREGMLDAQDPAAPRTSLGAATPTPGSTLRTIGVVSVMGSGLYQIEDRGEAACPDGSSGHALHLTSRTRDPGHQLTDVIVDLQSMRFCMLRFAAPTGFGFHGLVEQHYANVGGYWLQTDGLIDGTMRAFGVSMHHGVWRYRLLDMQFPASLPADAFSQDAPLPVASPP